MRMLLLAFLLAGDATVASTTPLPPHAHARSYGEGWECDSGYQRVRQTCVAVVLPANARLDRYGSGWECNRGYRTVDGSCASNDWVCDSGYERREGSCSVRTE